MKIGHFEEIEAWQLARELTRKIYGLTYKGKMARDFGLTRQIQNAAGSVMHNIAEGFESDTNAEFLRFLRYAKRAPAPKFRASSTSPWTKITYQELSSRKSTITPAEREQPFVVL